jgi:hypothetical protein
MPDSFEKIEVVTAESLENRHATARASHDSIGMHGHEISYRRSCIEVDERGAAGGIISRDHDGRARGRALLWCAV